MAWEQVTADGLTVWRSPRELVDATPARDHLYALSAVGIGYKKVARLTGLAVSCVGRIRFGGAKTVQRGTAAKILAVDLPDQPAPRPVQRPRPRVVTRRDRQVTSKTQPRTGSKGSVFEAILSTLDLEEQPWRAEAECRDPSIDQELFFPAGAGTSTLTAARVICARCPVSAECLEAGWHEPFGVWGGMSARERQAVRARARVNS